MGIDTSKVVELRRRTGIGVSDCQKALEQSRGDMEQAIDFLRKQGALKAAKKMAERTAQQGIVSVYQHAGGRVGTMVEVNCETDFGARNDSFQAFAHDVAMHIAASSPQYVSRMDVPADVVNHERAIYVEQVQKSGKPANIAEKIVVGKLEQFYRENCLLEQPFIKDDRRTVQQMLEEQVQKIGEKIVISRFARFQVS